MSAVTGTVQLCTRAISRLCSLDQAMPPPPSFTRKSRRFSADGGVTWTNSSSGLLLHRADGRLVEFYTCKIPNELLELYVDPEGDVSFKILWSHDEKKEEADS